MIVIVPREQFGRARLSLQSVLDSTERDYLAIYLDGNSPPNLARDLESMGLIMTDRSTTLDNNSCETGHLHSYE